MTPDPNGTPEPQTPAEKLFSLEHDYGVLLRYEGQTISNTYSWVDSTDPYKWTVTEIDEIYAGVVATATAFGLLSERSETDTAETDAALFKIIMTQGDMLPYIVVYKWVGLNTSDAAAVSASFKVLNRQGEEVDVAFTETVNNGGCKVAHGSGSDENAAQYLPRFIICNSTGTVAGEPFQGQPLMLAGIIGLQGNRPFTRYVLVHELGHVFTNRTRHITNESSEYEKERGLLFAAIENTDGSAANDVSECSPAFRDPLLFSEWENFPEGKRGSFCGAIIDNRGSPWVVMGRLSDGWARGPRGWGSSDSRGDFTDFQQHPQALIEEFEEDDLTVMDETAADMFLNWVYRTVTNTEFDYQYRTTTSIPESWNGFANINASGQFDTGSDNVNPVEALYPGDARFEWMNVVMNRIFEIKGW
jgi:hypothetical protein